MGDFDFASSIANSQRKAIEVNIYRRQIKLTVFWFQLEQAQGLPFLLVFGVNLPFTFHDKSVAEFNKISDTVLGRSVSRRPPTTPIRRPEFPLCNVAGSINEQPPCRLDSHRSSFRRLRSRY